MVGGRTLDRRAGAQAFAVIRQVRKVRLKIEVGKQVHRATHHQKEVNVGDGVAVAHKIIR